MKNEENKKQDEINSCCLCDSARCEQLLDYNEICCVCHDSTSSLEYCLPCWKFMSKKYEWNEKLEKDDEITLEDNLGVIFVCLYPFVLFGLILLMIYLLINDGILVRK